jgi:hypothetical protein
MKRLEDLWTVGPQFTEANVRPFLNVRPGVEIYLAGGLPPTG